MKKPVLQIVLSVLTASAIILFPSQESGTASVAPVHSAALRPTQPSQVADLDIETQPARIQQVSFFKRSQPPKPAPTYTQTGVASWYGEPQHTASGERFKPNEMTAAHRRLPMGTLVRVTNLRNNRSAVVRINDRGPFKKGRILDLSKAAARELSMIHSGTAKVRIEVLPAAQEIEL